MDFSDLTEGQAQALDSIERLGSCNRSVLIINGYAGVGKTTLLKIVAQKYPDLLVLTPTGKAALRVKEVAGCHAETMHKWLYIPEVDSKTLEVSFRRKNVIELYRPNFHSIVVDEASMVSESLWNDLQDAAYLLGLNIVLVGDSFQLPPVEDDFSIFKQGFKQIDLTEVVRQTLDSPIIQAATALRLGQYTKALSSLPIVKQSELISQCGKMWANDGIILCHTNETRNFINTKTREHLSCDVGRPGPGEPLLVQKNNYGIGAFNGEVIKLESFNKIGFFKFIKDKYSKSSAFVNFAEVKLNGLQPCVIALEQLENKISNINSSVLDREVRKHYKRLDKDIQFLDVNYGYCLTTHKSQGSEWDSALVLIEPTISPTTLLGRRFLYTAITRAKREVKICWWKKENDQESKINVFNKGLL